MFIFDIESRVQALFDEAYPPTPSGDLRLNRRGYKPLFGDSLGFIVPDSNTRRLVSRKEYFQVDLDDFLEFATSTLPSSPTLSVLPNETLLVYGFVDSADGGIESEYLGSRVKVSLLDAIIARHESGVSVTARLAYRDHGSGKWVGTGPERWEELVTLTYFPSERTHPGEGENLLEWDRNVLLCPTAGDDEWRLVVADGPYAEYLKQSIEKDPQTAKRYEYVSHIVEQSKHEIAKYAVQIELARLCLDLPQYVAFMYDLVSTERVRARSFSPQTGRSTRTRSRSGIVYKLVKSIRVVRPAPERRATVMAWHSPRRRHLVSGHWRVYLRENFTGRDWDGNPIAGRTWIRQHARGAESVALPDVAESQGMVTIHVKQTLESARDELLARTRQPSSSDQQDAAFAVVGDHDGRPTREWMAQERAKLTAGLRYFVLKRDGFSCRACGASPVHTNGVFLEVDHVRSIEQWGRTEADNLQCLCRDCNRGKGARK